MESTHLAQADPEIKRSKSMHIPSYHPKHTYYNIQDEIIQKNAKYGSFSANRKHFRNKLSKSASNLYQTHNVPFAQYTPDPYYGVLPNHYLASSQIHLDPEHLYINSKDDISVTSKEESDDDEHDCVRIADTSSNSSFDTTDSHFSPSKTSTDILYQIIIDNRESSHHPLLGMALVTMSAIAYAILNLSVTSLMSETPWQELMFIRMTVAWVATMIWLIVEYKGKLSLCGPKHQRVSLALRGFFLWGAMFACWWSFEYLPISDATTLAMTFPVWVSIFAHFVWKNDHGTAYNSAQRLDLFGWICVLAGLLGIIFVAQPSFIFGNTKQDLGIVIGTVSAICAGAQYVVVNYTKKDTHWLQVEQTTAALSTFVLCPIAAVMFAIYNYQYNNNTFVIGWKTLSAARWVEEIALGLLGLFALALLTRAAQLDAPARTAMCLYLEIPFLYITQCILTKAAPDVWMFIGICLVLGSVFIPAARKLRTAKRQKLLHEKLRMRYSDDSSCDLDERAPLLNEDIDYTNTVNLGAVSGVTVEWSSEDSCNADIDDEHVAIL